MSKICKKCGNICDNDSVYCPNCGKKQRKSAKKKLKPKDIVNFYRTFNFSCFKTGLKPRKLKALKQYRDTQNACIMLATFFCGAVILTSVIVSCFTQSSSQAVRNMIKGIQSSSSSKYCNSLCPDTLDENSDTEYTQFKSALSQKYGEDFKANYNITYKSNMTKQEISSLKEKSADFTGNSKPLKISAAKTVEVEIKFSGSLSSSTVFKDFRVIKVGANWYIWNEDKF